MVSYTLFNIICLVRTGETLNLSVFAWIIFYLSLLLVFIEQTFVCNGTRSKCSNYNKSKAFFLFCIFFLQHQFSKRFLESLFIVLFCPLSQRAHVCSKMFLDLYFLELTCIYVKLSLLLNHTNTRWQSVARVQDL